MFIILFFNFGLIGVFVNVLGGYKVILVVLVIFGFLEIIIIVLGFGMVNSFGFKLSGLVVLVVLDKELIDYLIYGLFFIGFNGMFDWNFIFGLLMIIGGGYLIVVYIVFLFYLVGMLVLV